MAASPTPALVRIGTEVSGDPALIRVDLAKTQAVHLAFELVKVRTGVDLWKRIIQAQGGANASAGTHRDGAALDLRTRGLSRAQIDEIVLILRECGFPATWYRNWTGNQHIHSGAYLGGAVWTGVLYQVGAVMSGYDGTGARGRGGKDDGPQPSAWRTAAEGADWARQQLADIANPKPSTPTPEGDLTMSDITEITAAIKGLSEQLTYMQSQLRAIADGTFSNAAYDKEAGYDKKIVEAAVKPLSDKLDALLEREGK